MTSTRTEVTTHDGTEQPDEPAPSRSALAVRAAALVARARRRWVIGVVVAVVVVVALAMWRLAADELPEGAAFRLGDTTVTAADVDHRIDALHALYGVEAPDSAGGKDTFRGDAAKSMAVQIMLEEEAADRDIAIAEKDVSDTLQVLIDQRYPDGGRDAFVGALGEMGATEDQVRDEIRSQLLVSRLFDQVVDEVTVSDDELRTAFGKRREDLATPVRRVLRNVVVADRSAATTVLRLVRSGTSFDEAASRYSLDEATRDRGGWLGVMAADDLEKGYADAAFGVRAGELFGPVRSRYGWNVGRVDRVVAAKPATFAEVRTALRESLLAEESLKAWRAWLKDVIGDHDVTYADGYRPDDPGAVPDIDEAQLTEHPGSDKE